MKKNVDADRIRAAFKATQGIVEHSFEQHVIDASQADVNAMIERIASGESSFEEEDEVLMMKWRAMKALQDKGSYVIHQLKCLCDKPFKMSCF
jgi:hypothetical protein